MRRNGVLLLFLLALSRPSLFGAPSPQGAPIAPEQRVHNALASDNLRIVEGNLALIPEGTAGREAVVKHLAALRAKADAPIVDAAALRGLSPTAAVQALKRVGNLKAVSWKKSDETVVFTGADGASGLIQYSRGRLLFLRLTLSERSRPARPELLKTLGIKDLPPATSVWPAGQRWEKGVGPFKMVEAYAHNQGTLLGVNYVEKAEITKWENEE